jgi:hypothetical protein
MHFIIMTLPLAPFYIFGAYGSVVVKTLCYKPEGRGSKTDKVNFFLVHLILPAALGPGVHSTSTRD